MRIYVLLCTLLIALIWAPSALALTVISPVIELELEPGETQSGVVKVFNETEQTVSLSATIESFTAGGESGQPVFTGGGAPVPWITIQQSEIVLLKHQVTLVPFTISVPAQAEPGGYYAAVLWQETDRQTGTLSVSNRVGTLLLITVKGEASESLAVESFSLREPAARTLPVSFVATLRNEGTTHQAPGGTIEISNFLGKSTTLLFNAEQGNVLPNSSRHYEVVWGKNGGFFQQAAAQFASLAIGPHRATLRISYGNANQELIAETRFWLAPVELLTVLIVVIAALIVFIMVNRKMKKIRNRLDATRK